MKTTHALAACLLSFACQARDISYRNDDFAYLSINSCAATYVDIDAQATQLTLSPAGAEPATDEGAAWLTLPVSHQFYDQEHEQVVVSANGYLAFAADLQKENGADFSNDCPFPSVPDNQPQSLQRIMPFHDDLMADDNGVIQWAHFSSCPTVNASSSCTVIEWKDWRLTASAGAFSFQVVLLHQPAAVVMQYDHRTPAPASASVGIQHAGLFSGQVMACNQSTVSLAGTAICYSNQFIFSDGFEQ